MSGADYERACAWMALWFDLAANGAQPGWLDPEDVTDGERDEGGSG